MQDKKNREVSIPFLRPESLKIFSWIFVGLVVALIFIEYTHREAWYSLWKESHTSEVERTLILYILTGPIQRIASLMAVIYGLAFTWEILWYRVSKSKKDIMVQSFNDGKTAAMNDIINIIEKLAEENPTMSFAQIMEAYEEEIKKQ